MAQATISPARALARLMVAAFVGVVLFLVLMVGAIGVADPADSSGAVTPTPVAASP